MAQIDDQELAKLRESAGRESALATERDEARTRADKAEQARLKREADKDRERKELSDRTRQDASSDGFELGQSRAEVIAATAGATAAANQHITVSGTGEYKHGSKKRPVSAQTGIEIGGSGHWSSATGYVISDGTINVYWAVPIPLDVGERITALSYRVHGEAATANVRVEYNPITDSMEAVTIYYYDDGMEHKLLGCRGEMGIVLRVNELPKLRFRFLGLDGGDTAAANPALTLTAWKTPAAVTDPNTGDLTFGCSYVAATPAISAGTAYPSTGIEIALGNALVHTPLLGGQSIDITARTLQTTTRNRRFFSRKA